MIYLNRLYSGNVGEFIMFNEKLDENEIITVKNYLMEKWQ